MARRRKGRPVSGWVCLDKPYAMTSTSAVSRVRRVFEAQKAGHAGTLDPLATGILPIALGEATKTVPFLMDADKAYRFTIRWGETTASFDAEGEVTATSGVRPTREQVEAALPAFLGEVMQVPPAFSAIKVDGERAYDLARAGEVVELKARPVRIDSLDVVDQPDADQVTLEMVCGKGTYVRAVVRDLAEQLGACGRLSMLRRTRVGRFTEDRAVTVEKLDEFLYERLRTEVLLPVETALDGIPALALTDQDAADLRQGRSVVLLPSQREALAPDPSGTVAAFVGTRLQALCEFRDGGLWPVRVLHPDAED